MTYSTDTSYHSPASIQKMQERKLQRLLQYLQANSPFYKKKFEDENIDIATIKKLDHLTLLPTTCKEDLQQYNRDFICVPTDKIIEYSSTSGTLGSPVTVALTENDLNRLLDLHGTHNYNYSEREEYFFHVCFLFV